MHVQSSVLFAYYHDFMAEALCMRGLLFLFTCFSIVVPFVMCCFLWLAFMYVQNCAYIAVWDGEQIVSCPVVRTNRATRIALNHI